MTPDSLESLSDQALNEVFAREVAQLVPSTMSTKTPPDPALDGVIDSLGVFHYGIPPFTTSSDSVLPYLEKTEGWQAHFDQGEMREYTVEVYGPYEIAESTSFARSACLALIKAHRAAKAP